MKKRKWVFWCNKCGFTILPRERKVKKTDSVTGECWYEHGEDSFCPRYESDWCVEESRDFFDHRLYEERVTFSSEEDCEGIFSKILRGKK